jgi:DNA-directed RNA polymerase subunit RPC12/RpoP
MDFKPAKCPSCSGDLQVPANRDVVKCMYCGTDIVVREAIQAAGGNVQNWLMLARTAMDSNNAAEAYR